MFIVLSYASPSKSVAGSGGGPTAALLTRMSIFATPKPCSAPWMISGPQSAEARSALMMHARVRALISAASDSASAVELSEVYVIATTAPR